MVMTPPGVVWVPLYARVITLWVDVGLVFSRTRPPLGYTNCWATVNQFVSPGDTAGTLDRVPLGDGVRDLVALRDGVTLPVTVTLAVALASALGVSVGVRVGEALPPSGTEFTVISVVGPT